MGNGPAQPCCNDMAVFLDKNGHWAAFIPDLKEVDFFFSYNKESINHTENLP